MKSAATQTTQSYLRLRLHTSNESCPQADKSYSNSQSLCTTWLDRGLAAGRFYTNQGTVCFSHRSHGTSKKSCGICPQAIFQAIISDSNESFSTSALPATLEKSIESQICPITLIVKPLFAKWELAANDAMVTLRNTWKLTAKAHLTKNISL